LKGLLSSFKEPSSQRERERERERERRKEGRSPGQPVGKEKIKGNLIFWGRSFGRSQALDSPENKKIVGSLKLVQVVHKVKWT